MREVVFNDISNADTLRMLRVKNFWINDITETDVTLTLNVMAAALNANISKFVKNGGWETTVQLALSIEYLG